MENPRAGEKRSMYLTRKDFLTHGHTPGCPGCLDIASGKPGPSSALAPHTKACRSRMNEAIKSADPARREKYLRRRGENPVDAEGPPAAAAAPRSPPAIEEAKEEEDDGWDELWNADREDVSALGEEGVGPGPGLAPDSLGSGELVSKICSMLSGCLRGILASKSWKKG